MSHTCLYKSAHCLSSMPLHILCDACLAIYSFSVFSCVWPGLVDDFSGTRCRIADYPVKSEYLLWTRAWLRCLLTLNRLSSFPLHTLWDDLLAIFSLSVFSCVGPDLADMFSGSWPGISRWHHIIWLSTFDPTPAWMSTCFGLDPNLFLT